MPSDKERLYVALYARGRGPTMPGGEDKYHWALMTGPKDEEHRTGWLRCDVKQKMQTNGEVRWTFEIEEIAAPATRMLAVRIMIAKVADMKRLLRILRDEVPLRAIEPGWNCVWWVRDAIDVLSYDGKALSSAAAMVVDWETIRETAMWYVAQKAAEHRFDGKGDYDMSKAATYDLLQGQETIE